MAIFEQKGSRRFERYSDAFETSEGVRRGADSVWWSLRRCEREKAEGVVDLLTSFGKINWRNLKMRDDSRTFSGDKGQGRLKVCGEFDWFSGKFFKLGLF